ncbi:MAG: DUF885 family protein, partial [Calditrichaeota bacterium]|nr:DUF885 family protein [Calditrichota bacterium]
MKRSTSAIGVICMMLFACNQTKQGTVTHNVKNHDELVQFFKDWRKFNQAEMTDGVPDYSNAAMSKQYAELANWQASLNAVDTTGWSTSDRIDWTLIWAEMNGMDFEHRVTRPWERDPAFYVWFAPDLTDVPEREGPNVDGYIEYAYFDKPLSAEDAASIAERLNKAPQVFEQAKVNLTGNARDLWINGTKLIRAQSDDLVKFGNRVVEDYPDLAAAAVKATEASNQFADWLDSQAAKKTGTSGVGKENYNWYLKNVHLRPYTWDDEVLLMKRELVRAHTALRLEENRHRNDPPKKMQNADEYDRRMNQGVDDYVQFLKDEGIFTVKDYAEPALRARIGKFSPPPESGVRGFFGEVTYYAPISMRTHDTHWIELARRKLEPNPNPIRAAAMLHNIFAGRSEGLATAMEEMMMHAGFMKDRQNERQLIWILAAQRAARGLGGLYQHGLEMTHDEATRFADKWTPWHLLPQDGGTIQWEEHFYLRQPAYGESYLIGKIEIDSGWRIIIEACGKNFAGDGYRQNFAASIG